MFLRLSWLHRLISAFNGLINRASRRRKATGRSKGHDVRRRKTYYRRPVGESLEPRLALNADPGTAITYHTPHSGTYLVAAGQGVLAGDENPTSHTATLVTGPENGTLSLQNDGSFSYAPDGGFTGADQFTFSDSDGVTAVERLVSIDVNAAPTSSNLTLNVSRQGTTVGGVVAQDADGDSLTAEVLSGPTKGQVAMNPNGSFRYTPSASGVDQFTYRVSDGLEFSEPATVSIHINAPPYALPVNATAHQHTAIAIAANYTDADGDSVSKIISTQPRNGTVTLAVDGRFTYVPNPGFVGQDSFKYRVKDSLDVSNTATVTIEVTNTAPTASDRVDSIVHNTVLSRPANQGVLAAGNASDADGDALTVVPVSNLATPNGGTVTILANGSFTYTPPVDFKGDDSFPYTVTDGIQRDNVTRTVTIHVTNTLPTTNDVEYSVLHDKVLAASEDLSLQFLGQASDADGDAIEVVVATDIETQAHGHVTINADGSFTYTPPLGYSGDDSFAYSITDGYDTVVATATVHVTNSAPTASNVDYDALHDTTLAPATGQDLLTLGAATDADSDVVTVVAGTITTASGGTVTFNTDGSFAYVSPLHFKGDDTFTYQVTDGIAVGTATATVHVRNTAPTTSNVEYSTHHGTGASPSAAQGLLVTGLASDLDGDLLSVIAGQSATSQGGGVTLRSDGSFDYMPAIGFKGDDSFTYQVTDGVDTATATVTFHVTNTAPTTGDISWSVHHDSTLPGSADRNLMAAGAPSDPDGDLLHVNAGAGNTAAGGWVTINADGTFSYSAPGGFVGDDTFGYSVSDGVDTYTGTVTISVTDVAPTTGAIDYGTSLHDRVLTRYGVNSLLAVGSVADTDGDIVSVIAGQGSTTANGTVTISADGSFSYSPPTNFVGDDSFEYTVTDGAYTATGTVTIHVTNTAPATGNATIEAHHDTLFSASQNQGLLSLGAPSDADGDVLQVVAVSNSTAANGWVKINSDGSFDYTPAAGYLGDDSFNYTVSDGIASATGTISIHVTNHAPTTGDVLVSSHHDTVLNQSAVEGLMVLGAPVDADGDALTVIAQPASATAAGGSVTINSDGSFTYTPPVGFKGDDTFSYSVFDGAQVGTATATIRITNTAPTTGNVTTSVHHDTLLSQPAEQNLLLIGGPTDVDGDPISIVSGTATTAGGGSVTINADGTFTYTPPTGFTGDDSFTYQVHDGVTADDAAGTVTITVTNTRPTTGPVSYSVLHDSLLNQDATQGLLTAGGAFDADGDTVSVVSKQQLVTSAQGIVTINSDGSFSYSPPAGFAGDDSFTYAVSDGATNDIVESTVTIHVNNTAPASGSPSYDIHHDTLLSRISDQGLLVTGNVSDADGDSLTIIAAGPITTIAGAVVYIGTDGSFSYAPKPGFVGDDSFEYDLFDGVARTPVTATIHVTNTAPTTGDIDFSVKHDHSLPSSAGNLMTVGGSTDIDGDAISVVPYDGATAAGGWVTINADGTFTYTPPASFSGDDWFGYSVTDGIEGSHGDATVSIHVKNIAPTSGDLEYSIAHDSGISRDAAHGLLVSGAASDDDGDVFWIVSGGGETANGGSVTINEDASFTYIASAGFVGDDSFQYEVTDGIGSTVATVTIHMTNTDPTTNDLEVTVHHDTTLAQAAARNLLVLGGATNADGDPLSVVAGSDHTAVGGDFAVYADGTFSYTPAPGFEGDDFFDYTVTDGVASATAKVIVHVTNLAPTATDVNLNVHHDQTLSQSGIQGLLAISGATDSDNDSLTVLAGSGATIAGGTVAINADGSFDYTPPVGFFGEDTFTFTVTDGITTDNVTAKVTIEVVEDAPVVTLANNSGSFTISGNSTLLTNVSLNDNDDTMLVSTTVRLVNFPDGAHESLSADVTGTSIVANYDPASGTLTLTGVDTPANYALVLSSVTYSNTASTKTMGTRTIEYSANDGLKDSVVAPFSLQFVGSMLHNVQLDQHAINEGGNVRLTGHIYNVYGVAASQITAQVNWGDSSPIETLTLTANPVDGWNFSRLHQYRNNGPETGYPVTITARTLDPIHTDFVEDKVVVTNVAPTITASLVIQRPSAEHAKVKITGTVVDPGLNDITEVMTSYGSVPVTETSPGHYKFESDLTIYDNDPVGENDTIALNATVTDSDGASASVDLSFDLPNEAPVITVTSEPNGTYFAHDGAVRASNPLPAFEYSYADNPNDTLTWSISIDNNREVLGKHSYTLTVTDEDGGVSKHDVSYEVIETNGAPTLTIDTPPNGTYNSHGGVIVGTPLPAITPVMSDPDGDSVTPTITDPGHNSLDEVGIHDVVVTADDGHGGTATQTVSYTVADFNRAPVISITQAPFGTYYRHGDEITNGPIPTLDYTISDADGDTFDYAITGGDSPNSLGEHEIVITANDAYNGSDSETVSYSVVAINHAPVLTIDSGPLGTYHAHGGVLKDGPIPGIVWSTTDEDGDSPTVTQGVDSNSSLVGHHEIVVTADDGFEGKDSKTVSYEVIEDNSPPVISVDSSSPSGTYYMHDGQSDRPIPSVLYSVSDPDSDSVTKSDKDSLPNPGDIGDHVVTITADDGHGGTDTKTVSYTVALDPIVPDGEPARVYDPSLDSPIDRYELHGTKSVTVELDENGHMKTSPSVFDSSALSVHHITGNDRAYRLVQAYVYEHSRAPATGANDPTIYYESQTSDDDLGAPDSYTVAAGGTASAKTPPGFNVSHSGSITYEQDLSLTGGAPTNDRGSYAINAVFAEGGEEKTVIAGGDVTFSAPVPLGFELTIDGVSSANKPSGYPGAIVVRNADFSKQIENDEGQPIPDYSFTSGNLDDFAFDSNWQEDTVPASLTWTPQTSSDGSILPATVTITFPTEGVVVWNMTHWNSGDKSPKIIRSGQSITVTGSRLDLRVEGVGGESGQISGSITVGGRNGSASAHIEIIDLQTAVDGDRNGEMQFNSFADKTRLFWYNSDLDESGDGVGEATDYSSNSPDFESTHIRNARDLEDFMPFVVTTSPSLQALAKGFHAGYSVSYNISVGDANGNSGTFINVFSMAGSVDSSVNDFLLDSDVASQQVSNYNYSGALLNHVGVPGNNNRTLWGVDSSAVARFLIDFGSTSEILRASKPEIGVKTTITYPDGSRRSFVRSVFVDVRPFKEFYDRWAIPYDETARTAVTFSNLNDAYFVNAIKISESKIASAKGHDSADTVVLAHGWNMDDQVNEDWKQVFAETAFKRLIWQGYTGHLAEFDWPTYTGALTYNQSEYEALRSGRSLERVLDSYNGSGSVRLIAHSMGNVVAAEALRYFGTLGRSAPLVSTYSSMQGAATAGAYGDDIWDAGVNPFNTTGYADLWRVWLPAGTIWSGTSYMDGTKETAGEWLNYYNPTDFATSVMWRINNLAKEYTYGFQIGSGWPYSYDRFAPGIFGLPEFGYYRAINLFQSVRLDPGRWDASGGPGANAFEILAFMSQSWAAPIGTRPVLWFDSNVNITGYMPPSEAASRNGHSFEFLFNAAATKEFWSHIITDAGLPVIGD